MSDWDNLVEPARATLEALIRKGDVAADRIEELEAKLAKAVEALSGVMVGGNHLALLLPDNFLPAETEPLDALDMMGAGDAYEVWCCWRSIMLARTTLAELTGQKDE